LCVQFGQALGKRHKTGVEVGNASGHVGRGLAAGGELLQFLMVPVAFVPNVVPIALGDG
jgi:hypothetical protein